MNSVPKKNTPKLPSEIRREKEAAALRENLKRRKQQLRDKKEKDISSES